MRIVILSMMMSADGFMEGNDHDINWHVWDEEMDTYMMDFFKTVDTFLYGRKSYELMISYWPQQQGEFAKVMNEMSKIVSPTQ
ncbi:dihydrofolate reductase family protein [Chondrinema litorale]|uniref:dihydrofolate reductase family protein n=1 Tax=Chondrinema litorale TaxID=2994555 RepID=UPI002542F5E9|nr:dihydrofolate reductase family protein [Chondrinema litorale]UZR97095.1 dihydrofolate reductase family protein [Chondrinema litorale]